MRNEYVPYKTIDGGRYKGFSIEKMPGSKEPFRIYDSIDRFIGSEESVLKCIEAIEEFIEENKQQKE